MLTNLPFTGMTDSITTEDLYLWKMVLLCEWESFRHNGHLDKDEAAITEKQRWEYLHTLSPDLIKDWVYTSNGEEDLKEVLDQVMPYMSGSFQDAAAQLLEEES